MTSWYPSRASNNVGDFIRRHAEAVSLLHTVTVVHIISDKNAKGKIEISDEIVNNVRTLIAYIKPASNSILKAFRFIKAYAILLKKAGKYDIVHLNKLYNAGLIAVFLKFFKRKNYIISEHHHIYHNPYCREIGFLEKHLSKIITKNASFVCPVSDDLGKAMQKFGLKGKYHKIPNVVKTDIFYPKNKKPNETFTFLHVSGMSSLKNVDKILEVVSKIQKYIPNYIIYLIGNESKELKEKAKFLKIKQENIKFIGLINQKELSEYYRKSDVFILFSSIENLPCVILESFSSGTPVISTNVGGISEYFPENFGYLIEKDNKEQLLDRIIKLKDASEIAHPTTMHAYVKKNFSPNSIASQFDKIYRSLL